MVKNKKDSKLKIIAPVEPILNAQPPTEKLSEKTFPQFLKDNFQLITIMGVFGALAIYLNTSVGFINQKTEPNILSMLNINTTINANSILYSSGIKSYNDIALSIGIAASLWIFCIIAFNIFNEAMKNKYQNVMDSTSNIIFLFSLSLMILVMLFTVINQFINLYLSLLLYTFFTVRTRVKELSEAKTLVTDTFHKNNITIKYLYKNINNTRLLFLITAAALVFIEYILNIIWGIISILSGVYLFIELIIGHIGGNFLIYTNDIFLICIFGSLAIRGTSRYMLYRIQKVAGRSGAVTVTANS